MIFVPKIRFSRKGLPEGVSVGQSIFKKNRQMRASQTRKPLATNRSMEEQSGHFARSSDDAINDQVGSNPSVVPSHVSSPTPSLAEIVKEGVAAAPQTGGEELPSEDLKKQDEGALVNCMTLQW